MKKENNYEILELQIEEKRKEMIFLGELYGLTSLETIRTSQELDLLLNTIRLNEYKAIQSCFTGVKTKIMS